jgi:SAM-dependent methyltransferase
LICLTSIDMDPLNQLKRNWEGFAQTDPLWAICTDPQKKNNRWSREELFETGREEMDIVLDCVQSLGLELDWESPALDFGCGVGRLTRAMASRFVECWGVDISPTMIRLAEEYNRDLPHCHFLVNEHDRLKKFQEGQFGFIYTSIVLQHIPEKYAKSYVGELIRVLKPGGVLVFQIPDRFRAGMITLMRHKLALRLRLKRLTGQGDFAMDMHCIAESAVRRLVEQNNAKVLDARLTNSCDPSFSGHLRYLEEEPARGFVSKQYCVVKSASGDSQP